MPVQPILRLTSAPTDPIERIAWLNGVLAQVREELDDAYGASYFEARLEGRFEDAVRIGTLSRTRALALTRRHNERGGRAVRWGDGADPTSSAYEGG